MVNTELYDNPDLVGYNYNILNIVVNTEPNGVFAVSEVYYNILNIVVNTERKDLESL